MDDYQSWYHHTKCTHLNLHPVLCTQTQMTQYNYWSIASLLCNLFQYFSLANSLLIWYLFCKTTLKSLFLQQSGYNMFFSKQHSDKEERWAWDFNLKTLSYLPSLVNVISNKSMSIFFLFVILIKNREIFASWSFLFDTNFPSKTKKAKQLSQPASVYIPQHVFISYIFTSDYLLVSLFGE